LKHGYENPHLSIDGCASPGKAQNKKAVVLAIIYPLPHRSDFNQTVDQSLEHRQSVLPIKDKQSNLLIRRSFPNTYLWVDFLNKKERFGRLCRKKFS